MEQNSTQEPTSQNPSAKSYANFRTYYLSFQIISFFITSVSFVFLYFVGMYIYFLIYTVLGNNPIIEIINQIFPWTKNIENIFLLESGIYDEFKGESSIWLLFFSIITGAFFSYFKIRINLKKILICIAILMLPIAIYAYITYGSQFVFIMYYFISLGMLFIYMKLMAVVDSIDKVLDAHRRILQVENG